MGGRGYYVPSTFDVLGGTGTSRRESRQSGVTRHQRDGTVPQVLLSRPCNTKFEYGAVIGRLLAPTRAAHTLLIAGRMFRNHSTSQSSRPAATRLHCPAPHALPLPEASAVPFMSSCRQQEDPLRRHPPARPHAIRAFTRSVLFPAANSGDQAPIP